MSPQKIIYSCKSWKEFTDRLSELPTKKERGTVFEWFCKFYLQTNPKYKLYYKNVWHSSEFVKQTKHQKKLKIPDPEIGTDLVGQTVHGKYEIIQCKYKDDVTKNIYLSDIKSSITVASREVTRNYVDTILMCSNCQALTAKIKKLKHELQITSLLGGEIGRAHV